MNRDVMDRLGELRRSITARLDATTDPREAMRLWTALNAWEELRRELAASMAAGEHHEQHVLGRTDA